MKEDMFGVLQLAMIISTINGRSNLVQNKKAQFVLYAFKEIVRGVNTIEQIRSYLKDKLTNNKDKPICKSQFYRMLKNETYAGRIKMGDEKSEVKF
ncbi:MAG: hypothetical protein IPK10_15835 [Bacteroidetes bacterium]|nr:hypothetical protein [Bacteroidota bacterium]